MNSQFCVVALVISCFSTVTSIAYSAHAEPVEAKRKVSAHAAHAEPIEAEQRAAAAAGVQDVFAGDSRMLAKRTLQLREAPLRDALADLGQRSGISLFADQSIMAERLTLISHDRPLKDSLQAAASALDLTWKRVSGNAMPSYVLGRSPEQAANEQAALQRAFTRTAKAVKSEAELFERFAGMSEMGLQKRDEEITLALPIETSVARAESLRREQSVLQLVMTGTDMERVAYKLINSLTEKQIIDMLSRGGIDYSYPSVEPFLPYPKVMLDRVRSEYVGASTTRADTRDIGLVQLRFSGAYAGSPLLRWTLAVRRQGSFSSFVSTITRQCPIAQLSPLIEESPYPSPQAHEIPGTGVTFDAEPLQISNFSGDRRRPISLGEAIERLDRVSPINIACDGYLTTSFEGLRTKDASLHSVALSLARRTDHHLWTDNGFLVLRSARAAVERWADPPSLPLANWVSAYSTGTLDVDEFAEMAVLPDHRLFTLLNAVSKGALVLPVGYAQQARLGLMLWGGLNRVQRRDALANGVPFEALSVQQKNTVRRAILDPSVAGSVSLTPGEKQMAELLPGGHFKVEKRETMGYGVRQDNRPPIIVTTPSLEDAIRYFHQTDSRIKSSEVKEIRSGYYSFIFESKGIRLTLGYVQLPYRWIEESE